MEKTSTSSASRLPSTARLTVVLANGEFPKKNGTAWALLAGAKRVVCCDGAADAYRRRLGKWPTVIVGDFDSLGSCQKSMSKTSRDREAEMVHVPDQNTNDLEKAMKLCATRGWKNPLVVGAAGKREDHTIGNVFRALDYGCEIVTDTGRFVPVCGKATIRVRKGAAVSVFAPDTATRMTSKGLEWPLDGVKFRNLYCATLNRATAKRVTLTATARVAVYCES